MWARSVCDVVGVRRAPDLAQQRAVGHQPAAVARERAQQVELDRRQVDLARRRGGRRARRGRSRGRRRAITGSLGLAAPRGAATACSRATSSRGPNGLVT